MCAFTDPITCWATVIEAPLPGRDVENGNRIMAPLERHNFDVQHEVLMLESESTQLGLEARYRRFAGAPTLRRQASPIHRDHTANRRRLFHVRNIAILQAHCDITMSLAPSANPFIGRKHDKVEQHQDVKHDRHVSFHFNNRLWLRAVLAKQTCKLPG